MFLLLNKQSDPKVDRCFQNTKLLKKYILSILLFLLQCSETCGAGSQSRVVSCVDSHGQTSDGCQEASRPSNTQSCNHGECLPTPLGKPAVQIAIFQQTSYFCSEELILHSKTNTTLFSCFIFSTVYTQVSMTSRYHICSTQTNPWHSKKETPKAESHSTATARTQLK